MKKHLSTIILVVIFLVGISVLLYPSVSNYFNSLHASKAIQSYDEALKDVSDDEYEKLIQEAVNYNTRLYNNPIGFYSPDDVEGYWEALDITGKGIMGYITIEKIDVMLPVYHGTSADVLSIAAGHLQGTSLPVGGMNTHVVLSAHRGLPSAKLFTHLDKMEVGDTFTLNVLNMVLTYEVSSIQIVEPSEVESLKIQSGKDLCTLVTCTPYGINSHRLLVHAERIENVESSHVVVVSAGGHVIDPLYVAPIVATPILVVLLIWLIVRHRRKRR